MVIKSRGLVKRRQATYHLLGLALLLKPLVVSLSNHVAAPFDRLRVSGSGA